MIINLTGKVGQNMLDHLIDNINNALINQKPIIQVMLNSNGGNPVIGEAIKDLIESLGLPLVAYGNVSSAALAILLNCNVERVVISGTTGVYHQTSYPATLNENLDPRKDDKEGLSVLKESIKEIIENEETFLKLTKAEKKRVRVNNEDLWLSTERIRAAVEESEKFFEKGLEKKQKRVEIVGELEEITKKIKNSLRD